MDSDEQLVKETTTYVESLGEDFTYRDYALSHPEDFTVLRTIVYYLLVIPLGAIGVVLMGLPGWFSGWITAKKTTIPEFIGALRSNIASILYFLYVTIILVILFLYCWHLGIIGAFVMVFAGLIATYFWDRKKYWSAHLYWKTISKEKKSELLKLREKLIKSI